MPQEMAVVGREYDQRALSQPQAFERLENPADLLIHEADHPVIRGDAPPELLFAD